MFRCAEVWPDLFLSPYDCDVIIVNVIAVIVVLRPRQRDQQHHMTFLVISVSPGVRGAAETRAGSV